MLISSFWGGSEPSLNQPRWPRCHADEPNFLGIGGTSAHSLRPRAFRPLHQRGVAFSAGEGVARSLPLTQLTSDMNQTPGSVSESKNKGGKGLQGVWNPAWWPFLGGKTFKVPVLLLLVFPNTNWLLAEHKGFDSSPFHFKRG